jgi:transposase
MKGRYALWKNPENLTERQRAKLDWIAKTDPRLYRAYLLKEGLRTVFVLKGDTGKEALDRWLSWAQRCRIAPFVELRRKIIKHRAAIDANLDHGLSNALTESVNTKIRLLTRIAFGFRSADALIALAMLALGGYRPALPGRLTTEPPTDQSGQP